VDPGIKGAICLFDIRTRKVQVFDTPVEDGQVDGVQLAALVDLLKFQVTRGDLRAVVENVCGRPRQMGVFTFGRSTGLIHGILNALSVPYETVAPSQWKPAMGLRRLEAESQAENKTHARELAMKLFPESAKEFARVKDDGRAECCLIAFFYAQKMNWL
jgi:hypothetical protein